MPPKSPKSINLPAHVSAHGHRGRPLGPRKHFRTVVARSANPRCCNRCKHLEVDKDNPVAEFCYCTRKPRRKLTWDETFFRVCDGFAKQLLEEG